jgi:hypothetical protein
MSMKNSKIVAGRTSRSVVFLLSEIQKTYWNTEVSSGLGIGQSTLRKWCMELERNGYNFKKGAMDSRVFTDQDIAALNYFKQLTKAKKHTREEAAKFVVRRFLEKGEHETLVIPMRDIRSIENILKQLLEQQKELLERLENIEEEIKKNKSSDKQ